MATRLQAISAVQSLLVPSIGRKIGYGWSAEVFEWEDDKVIKLFWKDYPIQQIDLEEMITKTVYNAGLPAPRMFQKVDVGDRTGLVMEKIVGPSLMSYMPSRVHRMNSFARELAELHFRIHRADVSGLPTQKELFREWIEPCSFVSSKQKSAVYKLMERLPDGDALCHNDFHPPNIIVTEDGWKVIDWVASRIGDPFADVAYSEMTIRMGDLSMFSKKGRLQVKLGRLPFSKLYRKHYLRMTGGNPDRMNQWLPTLISARFKYGFESEIPILTRMLRNRIPE